MLVLGIESTCDETGISLVEDGTVIHANLVLSQIPIHERFGGVVPEIASRAHVEVITRLLEQALAAAKLSRDARGRPPVDLIAVANRPGLIGSLLVGVTAAKCLSLAWGVPIVGVDHIHAHIYSAFLRASAPFPPVDSRTAFPAVALVVSGGHTTLYASRSWVEHEVLGSTIDDAVGEAFDKVASLLGLGYPGGPAVSRAAASGDPGAVTLPRTLLEERSLDFSFSGIKTAVRYIAKGQNAPRDAPLLPGVSVPDLAASFEAAVVSVLVEKLRRAVRREGVSRAIVAGGVAANRRLRVELEAFSRAEGVELRYPDLALCTDNAAMIAGLGYWLFRGGVVDDLDLDARAMGAPLRATP